MDGIRTCVFKRTSNAIHASNARQPIWRCQVDLVMNNLPLNTTYDLSPPTYVDVFNASITARTFSPAQTTWPGFVACARMLFAKPPPDSSLQVQRNDMRQLIRQARGLGLEDMHLCLSYPLPGADAHLLRPGNCGRPLVRLAPVIVHVAALSRSLALSALCCQIPSSILIKPGAPDKHGGGLRKQLKNESPAPALCDSPAMSNPDQEGTYRPHQAN
ncbi:hypothetical protein B0T26DRAFT_680748 [Lasiosphaeria miniovina]|uniref:Uncharacterized protein n=1 Tax=Lasiosphaeria miniovina TaxID=1954250 RepID=A0AA40DJF9_9PEZI|nr:uncharacterized protein B0T26DRAFT_680748 [Lasiosphaeria miniovina]KAK0702982.1 hypothetical protein B0T26DRAFT_680748 [Lasiosphaeria miniovina]